MSEQQLNVFLGICSVLYSHKIYAVKDDVSYGLTISTLDALQLSYRRLVVARPKLGSCDKYPVLTKLVQPRWLDINWPISFVPCFLLTSSSSRPNKFGQ